MAEEYMRTAQAAKFLDLSKSTLNRWRVTGNGPAFIKAGGAVIYSRADLVGWLAGRRRLSTSDSRPSDGGHAHPNSGEDQGQAHDAVRRIVTRQRKVTG